MERAELLAAGHRNLASTLRLYARTAPDTAIQEDSGLLLVSTSRSWPGPYHNAAIRLESDLPPHDVLARAEAFFSTRCPGFCVWIATHTDGDLERAALEAGYASISSTGVPRMALDHPLPVLGAPAGFTFEEVCDDRGRLDYLEVTVDAYADSFLPRDAAEVQLATMDAVCGPGVRAVVARENEAPVAAAMTVVIDGVAGIQMVGTVPHARRQGLAEFCTRWAVAAGFELGAGGIVLESSEAGEPLYLRMGFVEVSRYRWCFGPPPPTSRD